MSIDSAKTPGVVNIRYVVMSYLNKINDYSMRNYKRIAQIAIEGFTDLNLYHIQNIEVVYLIMTEAKTIAVPPDFIDWLKVGYPSNGKIITLTKNDAIALPREFEVTDEPVGNTDNSGDGYMPPFIAHYKDGNFVGALYGISGGFNKAYFRYDRELRQFVFTGEVPRSEIVLEYISSGVMASGSTAIPKQAVKALTNWIHWQTGEYDRKVPANEKERRKNLYYEDVEELRSLEYTPTMDEYRDAMYKMIRQSPKR